MKKLFAMLLALAMVFSMVACGQTESETIPADNTTAAGGEQSGEYAYPACSESNPVVKIGEFTGTVAEGYAVTAVGQSADIDVVAKLLDKAGKTYTKDSLIKADALDGIGTLFVAAGASGKGMGDAGISQDDELARADALFAACKEKNITVILVHVGGEARRGTLSDQFSQKVMDAASYMIVVEKGNADGFFSDFAQSKNIPLSLVSSMSNAATPITELFK